MKVSEAVAKRKSVRAFLDKPISNELMMSLLEKSAGSPSGGNLQPWRIYMVNGDSMTNLRAFLKENPDMGAGGYDIYPKGLKEPYRSSRYKVGEDMYGILNIARDDKAARFEKMMDNFNFFGAPTAIFCFVDKQMGLPQWSDLGMFLQTFMLLAVEEGLDTCAQEIWAMKSETIAKFVDAPEDQMLFCGMSIGYQDSSAVINELVTDREPTDTFVTIV